MVDVVELMPGQAEGLGEMTFPAYRHLLRLEPATIHPEEGVTLAMEPVALAALEEGRTLGLLLAALPAGGPASLTLLSLFVPPPYRRRGIGSGLITAAEELARRRGIRRLEAVYMTGKEGPETFERLIGRSGWAPPSARMVSVKFTIAEAKTTRWYQKYPLRSALEIFSWKDLTTAEREELITSHAASPWIAPDLVPWKYDARGFDPISSVGARLDGKVVGWVINHRLGNGTVRFTCSYIREDLKRRGRIVPLYSESIRRLAEVGATSASLTVPMHHREMVTFVLKHCKEWVTFVGETRGSMKELSGCVDHA